MSLAINGCWILRTCEQALDSESVSNLSKAPVNTYPQVRKRTWNTGEIANLSANKSYLAISRFIQEMCYTCPKENKEMEIENCKRKIIPRKFPPDDTFLSFSSSRPRLA